MDKTHRGLLDLASKAKKTLEYCIQKGAARA